MVSTGLLDFWIYGLSQLVSEVATDLWVVQQIDHFFHRNDWDVFEIFQG